MRRYDRVPELDDDFLRKVVSILNLPDNFRFNRDTMHTTVNVTSGQKSELKRLCDDNYNKRNNYNRNSNNHPYYYPKWSYGVLENYFDIYV